MPVRVVTALALLSLGLGAGCGRPAPEAAGPIVLITAGALRADVTGPARREPTWTPRLDGFAGEPGVAVVASSEPVVSAASLLTGVAPWQHQVLTAGHSLRPGLRTLAGDLSERGYRTRAYVPAFFHEALGVGFDEVKDSLSGRAAAGIVAELAVNDFLWLHFPDAEIARGRWRRDSGAPSLVRHRLLTYADPREALPPDERDTLWRIYRGGVQRLDRTLGQVLEALERSAEGERALVIVTATHGLEIGEHGQILYGENLGRAAIEVPLFVRLPRHTGAAAGPPGGGLVAPARGRVAQARVWATVAELVGLETTPVRLPSLFRESSGAILSELYRRDGVNHFSLLDGDAQLHWTARFAAAEPEYYPAMRSLAGARLPLTESARRIFGRLDDAFMSTPPLSGSPETPPTLRLVRWTAAGAEPDDDVAARDALAIELRRRWMRFVDRERPPTEERELSYPRGLTSAPALD